MSLNTGETDVYSPGGGAFGGMGGMGGFGLVGLIGLNSFLGQNGFNNGLNNGTTGTVVLEQNVANIREEIGALGNEFQTAINASNINNANNFRALDNQICGINQNLSNLSFAQTLQGVQNTQSIKDQATANQIIAAENACAIKGLVQAESDATRSLVHAETDRIIGLLNQTKIDDLREQLELERRGRRDREVEIQITNTATATQVQQQTQFQQQQQQFAQFANLVSDQLARQQNSIVNLGSMTGTGQSNSAAQTKVNS